MRLLLGSTEVANRKPFGLYRLVWNVFFIVYGQAMVLVVLADGISRGIPLRAISGVGELSGMAILLALIATGTRRDQG